MKAEMLFAQEVTFLRFSLLASEEHLVKVSSGLLAHGGLRLLCAKLNK